MKAAVWLLLVVLIQSVTDSVGASEVEAVAQAAVQEEDKLKEASVAPTTTTADDVTGNADAATTQASGAENITFSTSSILEQAGPLIDLFGLQLLSFEMKNQTNAELRPHFTSDALQGKKVVGVYFSADWCGPCRQFTPELVGFYQKINKRRKNDFEIVWVSRCRDVNSFAQFFAHMGGWFALPPEEAMGDRGKMLSDKFGVKGIPTLVLLDEFGSVITRDGRNKIPQDKAGIGFPWRNPISTLYMMVVPRSVRRMLKAQVVSTKTRVATTLQHVVGLKKKAPAIMNA